MAHLTFCKSVTASSRRLAVVLGLVLPAITSAQVHKCIDKAGKVQFSNLGCAATASGSIVDTRANSLDMSGMRDQNRVFLQSRQREVEEQRATMLSQQAAADPGDNGAEKNYQECASLVEGTRGITQQQKAVLLLRCQSVAQPASAKPSRLVDSCISRINALRDLSDLQRTILLVRCRGGGKSPQRDGTPGTQEVSPNPTIITSCDRGGCWDNLGGRYNGSGSTLFSTNGRACRRVGNMLQCDP